MATPITLTPQPIRVTTTGFQPIYLAADIGMFDMLDMELGVVALEGTSPTVTVELWTGMQEHTDDGWVQLYAWANQTSANTYLKSGLISSGLLRLLRWKVTTLGGSGSPAATFFLRGMGRRYS